LFNEKADKLKALEKEENESLEMHFLNAKTRCRQQYDQTDLEINHRIRPKTRKNGTR
jgi:hypothetical protein